MGYNNYTLALEKIWTEHKKKVNQQRPMRMRLLAVYVDKNSGKYICPTSWSINSVDRINDPDTNQPVDIAYTTGTRPLGPNSQRADETVMGEILFTRASAGMFEWHGEVALESIAKYLFFFNGNRSNLGKPYHIPPNSYHYEILGDEGATENLGKARQIDQANAVIEEICGDPDLILQVKMGMFPADYGRYTDEQINTKLRQIAANDPQKILNLKTGAVDTQLNASVNSFVRENLIRTNHDKTVWEFLDGTLIVKIPSDKTPYQAIKAFFDTDAGVAVFEQLSSQLEGKEPGIVEKLGGKKGGKVKSK